MLRSLLLNLTTLLLVSILAPPSLAARPSCGDGKCKGSETATSCPVDCAVTCTSACGDGVVECDEQCDDGNTVDGDGCSAACTTEDGGTSACNNNDVCDPGETCDQCGDCGAQKGKPSSRWCCDGGACVQGSCATDCSTQIDPDDPCPSCWSSALYPADWTPGFTDGSGRFLHDFSYAGYHNGATEPPLVSPGLTFDVVSYGADPFATLDSTAAIQAAIDAAEAAFGGIVWFPAGEYRCDGLLTVRESGVVLRGAGPGASRVFFTRFTGMTDVHHITFRGAVSRDADVLLATDGVQRSDTVHVADASGLAVGDSVSVGWVITDDFVAEHGMTGTWVTFNGLWKPFFRREIAAIDTSATPHAVTLDVPLRYAAKVRDFASLRRESGYIHEVGIEDLGLSNAVVYDDAFASDRAHVVGMLQVADAWVRNVASYDSAHGEGSYHLQSGGIIIERSKRVTVTDSRMDNAQHRGSGGNGYLVEVTRSSEVLFRDVIATNGRHNFIQNWDFGNSGCVWLRCTSIGSTAVGILALPAYSEYHHSLAMANLVDSCVLDDGWSTVNRGSQSSGAGHSATEGVFWNTSGSGLIRSMQYGWGYIIGTQGMSLATSLSDSRAGGTAPEDFVEGSGTGSSLSPSSLYEDQLLRRLQP